MECHTTLERVARRANEKCTKDSDSNPSVVNSESLVDTAIGVGESATRSRSVVKKTRVHNEQSVNGRTQRRKGEVTNRPKVMVKEKARAKENMQEKGTATWTRLDLRMKKLDSAGWMILVSNVRELNLLVNQENDDFETPRLNRAPYLFCVQKCNSISMDPTELPSSSTRVFSGTQGSEEPAGTHETKPDQSTGEALFAVECRDYRPFVDFGSIVSTCPVDYVTSVPTEKVHYSMNLESVLVNLCNITASSVMFFSPTELAAPCTSILKSLTRNVQFCPCTKAAAMAR